MPGGLEIVEKLRFLRPTQLGQSFEFDDDRLVTEEVRTVSRFELMAFIEDRQINFPAVRHAARGQFQRQRFLIDGLEEPAAQLPVYLHRRPDDRKSPRVPLSFSPLYQHYPQITQIAQIKQVKGRREPEWQTPQPRCTCGRSFERCGPQPRRRLRSIYCPLAL